MEHQVIFDSDLIRRYDKSGPRYTSYPTAAQFHAGIGEADYSRWASQSNEAIPSRPLSLYFHLPFCDTVCFYCACNKIVTKNRRRAAPYLERLSREMSIQGNLFDHDRTVDQLHWGGGTPTFISHEEMRALMQKTREHFNLRNDDRGEYSIEVDPREVDSATIALLRELGFNRISLGVQDFDPAVQKAVNRIQSVEQTLMVFAEARSNGFRSINMDLIYGLPRQTVDSFGHTLETIITAGPDRLSIFNYAHLPEMFKTQRQIDAELLPPLAEKLAILRHTINRLTEVGYVYIGMDHFARADDELAVAQRDGTLHRNFQGYSTHADCDLVAMGVTSISKVGGSYCQNEKTMEAFENALDAGRLSVMRGIELCPDDLLRREIIMQLICHFKLDFAAVEQKYELVFTDYFSQELNELQSLQADGLLSVDATCLIVSPPGKLLIRNVCMVFDRYLRKRREHRFSKVI